MNKALIATVVVVGLAAIIPFVTFAATGDFTGSIVTGEVQTCPGNWSSLLGIIARVIEFAIYLGILIAGLIIAYGAILLVLNPAMPENRDKAKKAFTNGAIGLAIVLASWLIVNTILLAMGYSGGVSGATEKLGTFDTSGAGCIEAHEIPETTGGGGDTTKDNKDTSNKTTGGSWTYDSGISSQVSSESAKLSSLLSCMRGKLPTGVGRISSISDTAIVSGSKTFAQCAASGCAHAAHSCHYGGKTCVGSSYAVDLGDDENATAIRSAASACGANYILNEGNHLHVSVGASCGCQ